ncbi:DUF2782 domain-containing protein [Gammaproteobacteria bacterium]|jgi:hypothetical protein|nr:DUF2782 domain-containing protein [Gammaproteobacteria bacterium]|tara:strand:- start:296 stop:637 length:342 start_codon:yes stop_codon:yes gene_type:complete
MKKLLISLILLIASTVVMVGNSSSGDLEPIPGPSELPDRLESGENIEPDVTIIHKDDSVVEEYRLNGKLYMVKVTPAVGPVYYLKDIDGNGEMELTRYELEDLSVPQWVLFTW